MEYISLKVIKVSQNIGTFFITKMTPFQLHKIANKNLSRLKDLENGIQRDLQQQKIKEIKEYLKTQDATFPNSIILAIQNNPAEDEDPAYKLNEEEGTLEIRLSPDVANILDGQHRLNGFDDLNNSFELPVSVFLDLSLGEQAKIFAKINSTQKKVDLSLVYDLFGMTEDRNPEKVAYYVVQHLNTEINSPWNGKIKTLADKRGDLAQGSMAKFIHKELLEKEESFKKLYDQQRDTDIKNILLNYFSVISDIFPLAWENKDGKYVLTKTTGFNGFISFLISLTRLARHRKEALSKEYFKKYLDKVSDKFSDFTSSNYPSGAVGQNKIRDILRGSLSVEEKEFLKIR